MTHTPGPWISQRTGWSKHPYNVHSSKRPGAVALIPSRTSVPLEEQEANARLIAEAPAMLEALWDLLVALEARGAGGCSMDNARAIIARIEGA
jgi:hypothetical protein